ncbi:MAG: hypothetical protein JSS81_12950 [Acidobacteria bacterium]|nr:hypothetical protein [Acidobacteriota bacterium]
MKWLRKFREKFGWLLALPLILVIGFLIIFAVGLAGGLVAMFLTKVPFAVWGSVAGCALLGRFGFGVWRQSRRNPLGFGWHLTRSIGEFQIFWAVCGILLIGAAITLLTAPGLFQNFWQFAVTMLGYAIVLIILFVYVFVCGEFLARAVIMFRRKSFGGGLFFLAVAGVGLALPGFLISSQLEKFYAAGNWPGVVLMTVVALALVVWLFLWFVMRAFEVDEWTLEDRK